MNTMASPILRIRNLKKKFSTHEVLDGVTLDVLERSVFSIIGKSGIGKSVLLKCVMNIIYADSGEIWYKNNNITNIKAKDMSLMRDFSYLFQDAALFDFLSVEENIAFPLREVKKIKDNNLIKYRVHELLDWIELPGIQSRMPSDLSGGMRKRVGLARTLAMEPKIMLCDEPTTGLDPSTGYAIMDLLKKTNQELGVTCIIITHDLPTAFRISDYFAFLDAGKIRVHAAKKEFIHNQYPLLQEFLTHSFVSKDEVL